MRPALSSIKVFSVVASVRSFTQAAQLLHVTQGAVSQQVAKLESQLGVRLFDREPRQLVLTQHGRRLYRGVSDSLERIEAELDAVVTHKDDEVLSITTFNSFAAQWLIPRLPAFEARHPQVRLHVDTSLRLADFVTEGFELGVRFGEGLWPGLRAEYLFSPRIYPFSSVQFAEKIGSSIFEPTSIANLPLYYDLDTPTEWSRWFAAAGMSADNVKLARGFSDSLVMLSGLRNGLEGVALVAEHLTQFEMSSGALVQLSDQYIEAEGAYYLVYPQQLQLSNAGAAFRDWLRSVE